jgi:hypothetical protein
MNERRLIMTTPESGSGSIRIWHSQSGVKYHAMVGILRLAYLAEAAQRSAGGQCRGNESATMQHATLALSRFPIGNRPANDKWR